MGGSSQNYTLNNFDPYSYTSPDGWSWVCEKPKPMSWQGGTKEKPITQNLQFENLQVRCCEYIFVSNIGIYILSCFVLTVAAILY